MLLSKHEAERIRKEYAGKARKLILRAIVKVTGPIQVKDLHLALETIEERSIGVGTVSTTVRQANKVKNESPMFICKNGDQGEHGIVSLPPKTLPKDDHLGHAIERINKANRKTKEDLKAKILAMSWETFESDFLENLLTAIGLIDIRITQKTRDNGLDAHAVQPFYNAEYQVGVQAKHWGNSSKISSSHIDQFIGACVRENKACGVLITSATLNTGAKSAVKRTTNNGGFKLLVFDIDQIVEELFVLEGVTTTLDMPVIRVLAHR